MLLGKTAEYWFQAVDKRAIKAEPGGERVAEFERDALSVRMFDVGVGEAILVSGTSGETILIDGGSTTGDRRNEALAGAIAGALRGKSLASFVATHPHKDHLGAIRYLVESHPEVLADDVWFYHNGKPPRNAAAVWWSDLNTALDARGVSKMAVDQLIHVPALGGLADAAMYTVPYDEPEYRSVFLHLRYRDARILFTGDAYCYYESKLLQAYAGKDVFASHVLKATHHGSQDGTGRALVDAVRPGLAFASTEYDADLASDDQHHAWEKSSKGRLPRYCRKFETYLHGDVELQTDGRALSANAGVLFRVRTQLPGDFTDALGLSGNRPRSYVADETTDPDCTELP